IRSLPRRVPISQNDLPQQTERKLPMPTVRTNGQSLSKSRRTAKFLNSYVPPREQYCFGQDVLRRTAIHDTLGNGSENRCSFILDENTTNSNLLDRILYGFASYLITIRNTSVSLVIQTRGRARPSLMNESGPHWLGGRFCWGAFHAPYVFVGLFIAIPTSCPV